MAETRLTATLRWSWGPKSALHDTIEYVGPLGGPYSDPHDGRTFEVTGWLKGWLEDEHLTGDTLHSESTHWGNALDVEIGGIWTE